MRSGQKLEVDEDGAMALLTGHQKTEKGDNDGFRGADSRTLGDKLMTGLGVFVWLVNFGAMAILFFQNDFMKDENVIAKYWTMIELLGFVTEYPILFI